MTWRARGRADAAERQRSAPNACRRVHAQPARRLRRAGGDFGLLVPARGVDGARSGAGGVGAGVRRDRDRRPEQPRGRGADPCRGEKGAHAARDRRADRADGRDRVPRLSDRPGGLWAAVGADLQGADGDGGGGLAGEGRLRPDAGRSGGRGPCPGGGCGQRHPADLDAARDRRRCGHGGGGIRGPVGAAAPRRAAADAAACGGPLALSRLRPGPDQSAGCRRPRLRAVDPRHQRRALPRPRPPPPAGRDDLHPARHHRRPRGLSAGRQRRAAPEIARRDGEAVRRLAPRHRGDPAGGRRLPLFARRPALRIPGRDGARGARRRPASGGADLGGVRVALSRRDARSGARHHRQGAGDDREEADRALFPHHPRDRAVRPRRGHPVSGARFGRQQRGVLRPRHHPGRSRPPRPAVRALHQRGPRRAARHRRRFRARAARGGDPAHLRQIRPPPRRPVRDRHPLPPPQRHPRGRPRHGPVRGRDRRPRLDRLGQLGREPGTRARNRSEPARPASCHDPAAGRADDRDAPASGPACRRLHPDRGAADRNRADRQRRHARPQLHRVGQGRHRRAWHPENGRAGAGDADLHP